MIEASGFNFLLEPSQDLLANFQKLITVLNQVENLENVSLEMIQIKIELLNQKIVQINQELEAFLNQSWSEQLTVSEAERQQWIDLRHRGQVIRAFSPYILAYSLMTQNH